jgi:hypothetical protein
MPKEFFELAADAFGGFLPRALRTFGSHVGGHNLKVWFGEETREHYEIQTLSRAALKAGGIASSGPALEIGFHAEHLSEPSNDDALAVLLAKEKAWRRILGKEPAAGRFAGRQTGWRRLSEIWDGGDLWSEGSAVEAAERLAAYVRAFEPIRAAR